MLYNLLNEWRILGDIADKDIRHFLIYSVQIVFALIFLNRILSFQFELKYHLKRLIQLNFLNFLLLNQQVLFAHCLIAVFLMINLVVVAQVIIVF